MRYSPFFRQELHMKKKHDRVFLSGGVPLLAFSNLIVSSSLLLSSLELSDTQVYEPYINTHHQGAVLPGALAPGLRGRPTIVGSRAGGPGARWPVGGLPRCASGWTSSSSYYLLLSSLELRDTQVYQPYIRALLGTASHFCEVVFLKLRTVLQVGRCHVAAFIVSAARE